MAPEEFRFERFDKSTHRREPFDCGNAVLNDYLKTRLNQQMKRGVTVGYVLASADGRIAGYVTLSSGELPIGVIPGERGFPMKLPLPTTLIGRLAVDRKFQGRGLGGDLFVHALRVAVRTAEHVASAVVEVDALDNRARRFCEHYGFARLPDDELHLYLPMPDARALIYEVFGSAV
jgi:GNAT superfamily N-acetyltransferase